MEGLIAGILCFKNNFKGLGFVIKTALKHYENSLKQLALTVHSFFSITIITTVYIWGHIFALLRHDHGLLEMGSRINYYCCCFLNNISI